MPMFRSTENTRQMVNAWLAPSFRFDFFAMDGTSQENKHRG